MLKVLRAEVTGMCFGVRDALELISSISNPSEVTIHGELVHNSLVLDDLERRGFAMTHESDRRAIPQSPTVLITAHGVSDRERERLEAAGKRLVDTTCPLVARAHKAAVSLRDKGYHVLLIGKRRHVEVNGIIEDLPSHDVIEREEEVRRYPHSKLGIVCQTTARSRDVERIRRAIEESNPGAEVVFVDTVCQPTKDHQRSLEELIGRVEAMVVVGGRNSNNTRELAHRCVERGLPTVHVEDAGELDADWFQGYRIVGLTAGTSTLAQTIDEVHRALTAIGALEPEAVGVT